MSNEAPPQFSPDGRYWWDGEQWIPVDQLPKPAPTIEPRQPAWSSDGGDGGGRPRLLFGAVAAVVVLVLAVVIVGGVTHILPIPGFGGPVAKASPTPTPKPKPTPTPPPPTLSGATAPALLAYMSANHINCNQPVQSGPNQWWYCTMDGLTYDTTGIGGSDPDHILEVIGQVDDTRSTPDSAQAANFLATVAGIPYTGSDQAQVQAWVKANMSGGQTFIGGVGFTVEHPSAGKWQLLIQPQRAH
ncbi:MAG TPA: hypothetical protein VIA06_19420 [Candidatus Dormibacteraeota bacterium]|nr:hypothetical protein [Candidatus Dormibacteraeota bacterium]